MNPPVLICNNNSVFPGTPQQNLDVLMDDRVRLEAATTTSMNMRGGVPTRYRPCPDEVVVKPSAAAAACVCNKVWSTRISNENDLFFHPSARRLCCTLTNPRVVLPPYCVPSCSQRRGGPEESFNIPTKVRTVESVRIRSTCSSTA